MSSKKPKIISPKDNGEISYLKTVKEILKKESVFSIIQRFKREKNPSCYKPIIAFLKQRPMPIKVCRFWLSQLHSFVNHLNKDAEEIILDTLHIPWEFEDEAIRELIHNLFESLVTHENYIVKPILENLFQKLKPDINNENSEALRINPFDLKKEKLVANEKIIYLIERIFLKVPWSSKYIGDLAKRPYFGNHVLEHVLFTYNLLRLGEAIPSQRQTMLEAIILNLKELDLKSPKRELEEGDQSDDEEESDDESEDLFPMEVDDEICKTSPAKTPLTPHPVGHCLDMTMCVMFRYIHFKMHGGGIEKFHCIMQSQEQPLEVNGCLEGSIARHRNGSSSEVVSGCGCGGQRHEVKVIRELYAEFKFVFKEFILLTNTLSHVQFLMFYLVCARPSLVSDFLDMLKCVFETSNANVTRKTALSYMGSFLARGNCVQFSHVHYCMQILHNWCKTYLQKQIAKGKATEDLTLHEPFYCACQTLFYVFTFNYKNYTDSEKDLRLAHSLHLDELVLCKLNPLRFCSPTTLKIFAKITNYFQLAYCYTILEKNRQRKCPVASESAYGDSNLKPEELEMLFPFDPYLLKRSNRFISKHYKKFEGIPDYIANISADDSSKKDSSNKENMETEDDAMWNSPPSFSYSFDMSPHIKCK